MAIICRDQGLLFIMVPHTACTAIGVLLRRQLGGVHIPADDIRDADGTVVVPRKHTRLEQLLSAGLITADERRSLVVAAGVRNPFDWLVSEYLRFGQGAAVVKPDGRHPHGDAAYRGSPSGFERWIEHRYPLRGGRRVQRPSLEPPVRWTEGADVVLRFEHLQSDLDALIARLGVQERLELPVVNTTVSRDERPLAWFYTPTSRRIVEEAFAQTLSEFGYRFQAAPDVAAAAPA